MFDGEVEADESYFGGHRKGRRGRGAAGKVAVFGLLKRNGKVYTVAVPNTQTATLLPIIREQVKPDSIVRAKSSVGFLKPQKLPAKIKAGIKAGTKSNK